MVLQNEEELVAMVTAAKADIEARAIPVTKDDVLQYVTAREDEGDAEWLALLSDAAKSDWRKLVDKYRRATRH